MTAALLFLGALMLGSAILAFTRRNLIHSALLLILTWSSVAGFYLWAGAEFIAFAQLLIYVGAVSMIVLFAVLLTRRSLEDPLAAPAPRSRRVGAVLAGGAVAGVLVATVLGTPSAPAAASAPMLTVKQIGLQLMSAHAASLLVVGVILTVALIGATVIAATDRTPGKEDQP